MLELLRWHWRKRLALPALCGAVGLATLLVTPPPSGIEFELGLRWQEPKNPLDNQDPGTNNEERQRFYDSAVVNFADARLVRATCQRLGNANPSDALLRAMARELQLNPVRVEVFRGATRTRDPRSTIEFLNRHIDGFVRQEVQNTLRVAQAHIDFLSRQVAEKNEALHRTGVRGLRLPRAGSRRAVRGGRRRAEFDRELG